jgi:hypothetical protein
MSSIVILLLVVVLVVMGISYVCRQNMMERISSIERRCREFACLDDFRELTEGFSKSMKEHQREKPIYFPTRPNSMMPPPPFPPLPTNEI